MPEVLRTDAFYTWTNELLPTARYGANPPTLFTGGGDSATVKDNAALVGLSSPVPLGSVVHSAKLRVRNSVARTTSTWQRARQITSNWDPGTLSWKTKPTVGTTFLNQSVTKATAPANTVWEFDVTTLMQAVANGTAKWYGIWIDGSHTNGVIGALKGKGTSSPEFVINYSAPVTIPEDLSPSNGGVVGTPTPTLSASTDYSGVSAINAIQVQLSNSEDFAAPIWDSGAVAATEPEMDLATRSGVPALAASVARWWRMRVRNPDGVWGPWSQPTSFVYVARGTLTITSPAAGSTNLGSTVPDINWTFTATQQFYQVIISEWDSGAVIYDSGKTLDSVPGDTPPSGLFKGEVIQADSLVQVTSLTTRWAKFFSNKSYRVTVRVWDGLNRQNVPGFPIYVEKTVGPLQIRENTALAPAGNVSITTDFPSPEVKIRFSAGTDATYFSVILNGNYYESGLPLASYLNLDTGMYEFTTTTTVGKDGKPNDSRGWQIMLENGTKTSANNLAYHIKSETEFAWISNYGATQARYRHVPLVGMNPVEGALSEKSQIVEPLRSQVPYKVFTVLGKYRGSVTAQLVPGAIPSDTRTMAVLKAAILEMRSYSAHGHTMKLTLSDLLLNVTIYNVNLWPATGGGYGRAYNITFDWFEV